ncbi:MAG TPA: YihY/virulence factor BrkB family protein [Actinomycetes bacterium]|nr:YihY/virulence factor BrkB family protein [Actinomycetes bacterium]
MAAGTEPKEQAGAASGPGPGRPARVWAVVWRLTRETAAVCFRYRVTGLAAEAGFFALLSLPPLVLGLVGSIGYLGNWIGDTSVRQLENRIIDVSAKVLTADQVREVIKPTLRQVFEGGRFDIISIGFVLALWSGSRALNVFIDTISIMYGLGGRRGIVRARALSFTLYVGVVVVGSVVIPLVLVGPSLLGRLLPDQVGFLNSLYWPVASVLSVLSLTTLYHISVPVRTPWRRDLPGALLTLVIWFFGSYVVRSIISISVGGTSIYGPLTAPIVLLIWLYVLAIAVLIGAALNAAVERIWPRREILAAQSARIVATPDFKPSPGMETGEVQLPPNRTPPVRPPAGRRRSKKPLARTDEPR